MIREEDPRFRHLERKIGIFIAIACAGALSALIMYGMQKDFFTKKYQLRFTADRGTGFVKGMPVKLSGFRIGRVTSIALNEQAMVDISIEIDNKYRSWIRNDSTAKLVKEGLVGDTIIDVSVGTLDKPELKDNENILYVKTKGLDELADDIAEKVKPVLIEVKDIISYINNPEGDLKKSVRNLEVLTRNLDGTRANADHLLVSATNNLERISSRTTTVLENTNRKIDAIDLGPTLAKVNHSLDTIDAKLPPMLDKIDTTFGNIDAISKETRKLSEKTLPRVPGLISQTEDVLMSTDRLLKSINNTWLFRDNAPNTRGTTLIRGDSYE